MPRKIFIIILILLTATVFITPIISKHNERVSYFSKIVKFHSDLFFIKHDRYPLSLEELKKDQTDMSLGDYERSISYTSIEQGKDCRIEASLWLKQPVTFTCEEDIPQAN